MDGCKQSVVNSEFSVILETSGCLKASSELTAREVKWKAIGINNIVLYLDITANIIKLIFLYQLVELAAVSVA